MTKPKDIVWAVGESLGYRVKDIEGGVELSQIGGIKSLSQDQSRKLLSL